MDEMPLRFFRRLGTAVDEMVIGHVENHVARYHLPPPRRGPLLAAPHPNDRIADVELAHMFEAVEDEGLTLAELSERFGRPASLILRELKAYERRHSCWVNQYAWASDLVEVATEKAN